jgi:hypothetical protein
LILLPASQLSKWRGLDSEFHYASACSVEDYLGTIRVDGVEVFVLGDEPNQTTAVLGRDETWLVRWVAAPNEAALVNSLRHFAPQSESPVEQLASSFSEREYFLTAAGLSGREPDRITVSVSTGPCVARTYLHQAPHIHAIVHVFSRG